MKMFLVVWMFFLMSTVRMTTELPSTVKKTRVKGTVRPDWYHWIGLEKDINRYRFLKF
jgi:hypothetical protein